jgi:hypothetical protein
LSGEVSDARNLCPMVPAVGISSRKDLESIAIPRNIWA